MEPVSNESLSAAEQEQTVSLEQTTQPFVGRWNQLVSQTNWEKGRIIQQWRETLVASDAPAAEYSDEAWSRRVGSVTGQHVGRLRRVYQRFGQLHGQFEGLYWSHFQACLDWDDAEMWLEGALQNGWSVSQMRHRRWETMGAMADQIPDDSEIVISETDEDNEHGVNETPWQEGSSQTSQSETAPRAEGPDFGDDLPADSFPASTSEHLDRSSDNASALDGNVDGSELPCPLSDVGDLPEDLAEAFESFKLAILHHKMDGWSKIPSADVLSALEALKQLAVAPSSQEAPF